MSNGCSKKRWSAVPVVLAMLGALLCPGGPADAADTVDSFAVPIASGSADLGGYQIVGIEPASLTWFNLDVTAKAVWTGSVNTAVSYPPDDVRQGALLAVTRQATGTSGAIHVVWSLSGTLRPLDLFDVDIGTIPLAGDAVSCAPRLDGGGFACTAESPSIPLFDTPCVPLSPYVDLRLEIRFDVTPEGAVVTRSFDIDQAPAAASTDLSLTTAPATEHLPVACNKAVGSDVQYALAPYHWRPTTQATQRPHIVIGLRDPGYAFGCSRLPAIFDEGFGIPVVTSPAFDLTGAGHTTDLGALQANNVNPTIAAFPPFSGVEGIPVHFTQSVTSQCPIGGYVWRFSDGTMSFGPTPQRAFGQDGLLGGELTVTDITNLSATADFSVSVANAPPVPSAGPNTSGLWGVPIAFNGQAVDPGWGDQPVLTYAWNWGDGTPGTGGAQATHVYRNPGDYVATLVVCDDHVCANDAASVHVRRRGTSLGYTGDSGGVFSASATLGASLADELGQAVAGASIGFTLGGSPAGSAQTDANGSAHTATVVGLPAGSYPVAATYPGSGLYEASAASATFGVTRMSSAIAYTGALSGAPNKVVTLSAYLTDGLGRALDGKVVVFTLGTQQVQATTGAGGVSGVASATLKLTQKNGKYALTAVWTPSGADGTMWTGASAAATFSLQSK
ncbi:MAG TPA: PKD domain-containing protein [Anaeromyxobacter sp.]